MTIDKLIALALMACITGCQSGSGRPQPLVASSARMACGLPNSAVGIITSEADNSIAISPCDRSDLFFSGRVLYVLQEGKFLCSARVDGYKDGLVLAKISQMRDETIDRSKLVSRFISSDVETLAYIETYNTP